MKKTNELRALYEAANIGSTLLAPTFAEVDCAIKVCIEKLTEVREYRWKLLVVVDYCKRISKGL